MAKVLVKAFHFPSDLGSRRSRCVGTYRTLLLRSRCWFMEISSTEIIILFFRPRGCGRFGACLQVVAIGKAGPFIATVVEDGLPSPRSTRRGSRCMMPIILDNLVPTSGSENAHLS